MIITSAMLQSNDQMLLHPNEGVSQKTLVNENHVNLRGRVTAFTHVSKNETKNEPDFMIGGGITGDILMPIPIESKFSRKRDGCYVTIPIK